MIVGTNGEAVELSAFRDGEGEGGRWSEATAAGVGAGDGGLAIGVGRGATTTAEGAETTAGVSHKTLEKKRRHTSAAARVL